jgi:hypothetical protein
MSLDMNKYVDEGEGITIQLDDDNDDDDGSQERKEATDVIDPQHTIDRLSLYDDQTIDMTPFNGKPNIYELFSVLIHSGSAMGGHYYAFIKSFENGKWYKFNDISGMFVCFFMFDVVVFLVVCSLQKEFF